MYVNIPINNVSNKNFDGFFRINDTYEFFIDKYKNTIKENTNTKIINGLIKFIEFIELELDKNTHKIMPAIKPSTIDIYYENIQKIIKSLIRPIIESLNHRFIS